MVSLEELKRLMENKEVIAYCEMIMISHSHVVNDWIIRLIRIHETLWMRENEWSEEKLQ